MQTHPLMLYPDGNRDAEPRIAADEAEEAELRKQGYKALHDPKPKAKQAKDA